MYPYEQQHQPHDAYQHGVWQQQVWHANGSPQTHNPSPHGGGYLPPAAAHHHQPPYTSHQHRGSQGYIAYSPRDSAPVSSPTLHGGSDTPRRTPSTATHTTFRVNGMHYRPLARRHGSGDTTAMAPVAESPTSPAQNHPQPRHFSPARRHSPIPPSQGPASPHSPTSSFASSARSSPSSWGYLFTHAPGPHEPPAATHKLHRLLTSIATYLSAQPPATEAIITRDKLSHYYGAFSPHPDLDHRSAYISTATNRGLARLWAWLGCKYYLVPPGTQVGEPKPALTISGFVTWSTVQLLLCPDLEVGVICSLLRAVELRDPETPNICWPRGLDRDAVGGVDPIAGQRWSRWWSVLLQPDDEEETDVLRRRVAELEEELLGHRRRQGSGGGGEPLAPATGVEAVWDRAVAETGLAEKPSDAEAQNREGGREQPQSPPRACARCGKTGWCGCRDSDTELGIDGKDLLEERERILQQAARRS